MIVIETGADDSNFGEMICHWDDDAALLMIRRMIEPIFRKFDELSKQTGGTGADQAEIQKALDELTEKARALIEEYAIEVFYAAQARLVFDIAIKLTEEAVAGITLQCPDGDYSLAENEAMSEFKELRKRLVEFFRAEHNKLIGVRRGRETGKKDRKPRARRETNEDRRNKILTAMTGVGRSAARRRDVARALGVSTRTLLEWLKEIKKETGEDWDDLVVQAHSKSGR